MRTASAAQRKAHKSVVGTTRTDRLDRNAEMTQKAGAKAMGENYEPKLRATLNFGPCLPLPLYPQDAPRGARVIQHNRHVVALAVTGPDGKSVYLGLFRLANSES